ncbi:hypothetical protein [Limnoglobus roseus]|uniref:Actin-binding WH2 domain-containing protein n=1 Tax=Limnoglobus roseus TaxID=2598579 RepID=A0A5C1APT7_9BACT|nr:hypothetical protein [Limnoglobus roseus]QEL20036.1 hypothetical protein PX52LOC_07122 [Limnoglobus roseus]
MNPIEQAIASILVGSRESVDRRRAVRAWVLAVGLGGGFYGMVMGAFGGLTPDRVVQVLYSAIKVPILLMATTLLAIPSFFVLNTLAGLRADFGTAVRAVLGTQAAVAILLAALAPYTAVWYLSSTDYHEATSFNALMFAIATFAAQWQLRQRYRELEARNARHVTLRRVWIYLYAFVGIQMGWFLRPFIGDPSRPPTFLRPDAWGNAYVVVVVTVWRAVVH